MPATQRNDALDAVRALAALSVLVHHATFSSGHSVASGISEFTGRLDVGVAVFFVLTGVLLFRPWVAALVAGGPTPKAAHFYLRRALRILPAYWVALVVLLLIGAVQVRGIGGFFSVATLTQIYDKDTALQGIVQAWSLATEVGFYLLLPLMVAGMARLARRASSANQRALVVLSVLAGLAVGAYLFRVALHLWGGPLAGVSIFWTPSHMDAFAAGMAVATLGEWRKTSSSADRFASSVAASPVALMLVAGILFVVMASQFDLATGLRNAAMNKELARHLVYTAIGLLLVAPWALGARVRWRRLVAPLATVGTFSYGVYLWHQAPLAGDFADRNMPWELFDGSIWPRLAVTVPFAIAVGGLSWWLVEKPALALSERWRRRR